MTLKAVLIGATSYLGGFVVQDLLNAGFEVTVIARNPQLAALQLSGYGAELRIAALSSWQSELPSSADVVVNLAYIKNAPPHRVTKENERLVDLICAAAKRTTCSHVIHASTIAVFGAPLRETPAPVAIRRRDNLYIDTKSQAEGWLVSRASREGFELSIVRLGNVIGPGSAVWTAGPAQRILDGRPVGWRDRFGPCNATFVQNASAYFRDLALVSPSKKGFVGRYHHLVEFADTSWKQIFTSMAAGIGVPLVSLNKDTVGSKARISSIGRLRQLYAGSFGSYARTVLHHLPESKTIDRLIENVRRRQDPESHLSDRVPHEGNIAFCDFIASPRLAPMFVTPGWIPPVALDAALMKIVKWLGSAGFVLKRG